MITELPDRPPLMGDECLLAIMGTPIPVERCDLTMDLERSPFIEANLTVGLPSPDELNSWDPRTYPVATLTLRQWNIAAPDATWAEKVLDLYVREITTDLANDTAELRLVSGEVMMDDPRRLAHTTGDLGPTTIQGLAQYAVDRVGDSGVGAMLHTVTSGGVAVTGDPCKIEPGESLSEFLAATLEAYSLRVYATSAGDFYVQPMLETTGDMFPQYKVEIRPDEMQSYTTELSPENDWYDGALVIYKWESAGVQKTAYDHAGSDGAYMNTRGLVVTRDRPYPGPGAAAGLLRRAGQRGKRITIRAVARYDVWPDTSVNVLEPIPGVEAGERVPRAITWNWPDSEMTYTLTEPIL